MEFIGYIVILAIAFYIFKNVGPVFIKSKGKSKEQWDEDYKLYNTYIIVIAVVILIIFLANIA